MERKIKLLIKRGTFPCMEDAIETIKKQGFSVEIKTDNPNVWDIIPIYVPETMSLEVENFLRENGLLFLP